MARRNKYAVNKRTIQAITTYGQPFKPALLPADIKRGPVGICFDWTAMEAARLFPKYQYVEGIATDPAHPDYGILHAWLTDGVNAFDPTWNAHGPLGVEVPVPARYHGIIMDIHRVAAFMKLTGHQGVLGNRNRARAMADRIITGK